MSKIYDFSGGGDVSKLTIECNYLSGVLEIFLSPLVLRKVNEDYFNQLYDYFATIHAWVLLYLFVQIQII